MVYADIQDDHARSNPETATYAEVHDYMSPRSIPVPEYPGPYEASEQNKVPAYQSVENKETGEDNVALNVAQQEHPEYPAPFKGTGQHEVSAYQSVENKYTEEDDAAVNVRQHQSAPKSASEKDGAMRRNTQQPGEKIEDGADPNIGPNEQLTDAVYATIDKSKKTKPVHKQVDAVYAQVNKSGQTKVSYSLVINTWKIKWYNGVTISLCDVTQIEC